MLLIFAQNKFIFIVPCPRVPELRTNCTSGFTLYDGPTGCVRYECNENLAELISSDNAAVEAALKKRNELGYFYFTDPISHEIHRLEY
jgi:hypothetical protein